MFCPKMETCEPEKEPIHTPREPVPIMTTTRLLVVTALTPACGWQYGDATVPVPPVQPVEFFT